MGSAFSIPEEHQINFVEGPVYVPEPPPPAPPPAPAPIGLQFGGVPVRFGRSFEDPVPVISEDEPGVTIYSWPYRRDFRLPVKLDMSTGGTIAFYSTGEEALISPFFEDTPFHFIVIQHNRDGEETSRVEHNNTTVHNYLMSVAFLIYGERELTQDQIDSLTIMLVPPQVRDDLIIENMTHDPPNNYVLQATHAPALNIDETHQSPPVA